MKGIDIQSNKPVEPLRIEPRWPVVLAVVAVLIVTLATLVLVRTFLGWTLTVEVEGLWPWQKGEESGPCTREGIGTTLQQGTTTPAGATVAETEGRE